MPQLIKLLVGLALSASLILAKIEHLHLDNNFMLNYQIVNYNISNVTVSLIGFEIEANVPNKSWVAVGFNPTTASMPGADLFMGGVNENGIAWGDDYHVSQNATMNDTQSLIPIKDIQQDFHSINGSRNGTQIKLSFSRLLDTNDTVGDVVISNKEIYVLWAMNNNTDNVTVHHTIKGSMKINLLKGPSDSGSNTLTVALSSIVLGVLVSIFRS